MSSSFTSNSNQDSESLPPDPDPSPNMDENESDLTCTEPRENQIFVQNILITEMTYDIVDEEKVFHRVYEINGEIFYEASSLTDSETLHEFEIRFNDNETETALTDKEGEITEIGITSQLFDETEIKYLEHTLEETPYGIIVNSQIILFENQWNTIISIDCELYCVICDVNAVKHHVREEKHVHNMEYFQPLMKFDLNIIRQVGDSYHCAICNDVIKFNEINEHITSSDHEDKILYARQRAKIVTDINNESASNENTNNGNTDNGNCFDRNGAISVSFEDECVDTIYEYDMSNPDAVSVNSNDGNRVSYAAMAKKPGIPKYVDKTIGESRIKIQYNSWHMIILPRPNEIYCMVCVGFDHVANKAKHCASVGHLEKLGKCEIIEKYSQLFVRKISEQYYHCGSCNCLELVSNMDNHVEFVHHRRTRTTNEKVNRNNDTQNPRNVNNETAKPRNVNNETAKPRNEYNVNPYNDSQATTYDTHNLYGYILVQQFCTTIRISYIAYNAVSRGIAMYFCFLCKFEFSDLDIMLHILGDGHVRRLRSLSFEPFFGVNLIRFIDNWGHCTICNVVFETPYAVVHVNDPTHIFLLRESLNFEILPILPPISEHPLQEVIVEKEPGVTKIDISKNIIAQKTGCVLYKRDAQKTRTISQSRTTVSGETALNINENVTRKEIVSKQENVSQQQGNKAHIHQTISNEQEAINQNLKTSPSRKLTAKNQPITVKEITKIEQPTIEASEPNDEIQSLTIDFQTIDFENRMFENEYVYLKFKNSYFKITLHSYNGLISVGDGTLYCFVCSEILKETVKRHLNNPIHNDNVVMRKFIDEYDKHILRQISYTYHCCTCNIIFTKRDLNTHIAWTGSLLDVEVDKITRKHDLKAGNMQITAETCKEVVSKDLEKELLLLQIDINNTQYNNVTKKNKIIVKDDSAYKITWPIWQGLFKNEFNHTCVLCQTDVKNYDIGCHVMGESHTKLLTNFDSVYFPTLIRKINDSLLNCLLCNVVISSKNFIVMDHINSKKHNKTLESSKISINIIKNLDCSDDILYL